MPLPGFDRARLKIGKAASLAMSRIGKAMGEPDDELVFYESLTTEELAQVQNKFPDEFPGYVKDMEMRLLKRKDG
jgi:hypothetical protein